MSGEGNGQGGPYEMRARDRHADKNGVIRCDTFGCNESHPIDHEMLGEESFATGRWLGWIYLDLNRPDLFHRPLRFCSVRCAQWWLDRESVTRAQAPLSPLDEALRSPTDEIKRRAAIRYLRTDDEGDRDAG